MADVPQRQKSARRAPVRENPPMRSASSAPAFCGSGAPSLPCAGLFWCGPDGGDYNNEARSRRMVGVDALVDPSCANMKQKPCGFHEAPAWRARRENGSVFAPRLCPLAAKARAAFLLASTIGGGGTRSVTEGVRLLLLAKRKCCAFCKNSRRNRFHYCLTVFFVI